MDDKEETLRILKCSERTLQTLRDKDILKYTRPPGGSKFFYIYFINENNENCTTHKSEINATLAFIQLLCVMQIENLKLLKKEKDNEIKNHMVTGKLLDSRNC